MVTTKSARLCAKSVKKASQERPEVHNEEAMKRRAALLVVVSAFLWLGQGDLASGTGSSGLRGVVERAPIRPVCAAEEACSAPAKNVQLTFARAGYRSAVTRTDATGRYRVVLSPGSWEVRTTAAPKIGAGISPKSVRVYAGKFRVVDFTIDTGIR